MLALTQKHIVCFFFQAEAGIRSSPVTGVQTCALPICALATVTLNSARELGLDKRMGSIEVGKDADLAIFNAHPLNSFARCELTLVDGEVFFSRQTHPTVMSDRKSTRLNSSHW